jgi:hypothetical protein
VDRGVQIHQIPAPVTGGEVGPPAAQQVDRERGALAAAEIAADPFVAPAAAARQPLRDEGFAAEKQALRERVEIEFHRCFPLV